MFRIILLVCAGAVVNAQFGSFHGSHGQVFPSYDLGEFGSHHVASVAANDQFPYPGPGAPPPPQHVAGPIMAVAVLNGKSVKGNVYSCNLNRVALFSLVVTSLV
ncbi:hypothetical protein WDU94_002980 [Cyamophila willieti]